MSKQTPSKELIISAILGSILVTVKPGLRENVNDEYNEGGVQTRLGGLLAARLRKSSSFVSECERYLLADIKRFISQYGEYCMCELR